MSQDDNGIAIGFGLLFLGGGLVFSVGSWGAYVRDTTLLDTGTRVQAQVVALERIRDTGQDGSTDHLVRYRFITPDGRTVERQGGLGEAAWRALRVGGPVAVVYSPDNPSKGLLVGGGVTSLGMVLLASLFGVVMGTFGIVLLASVARQYWTRRQGTA